MQPTSFKDFISLSLNDEVFDFIANNGVFGFIVFTNTDPVQCFIDGAALAHFGYSQNEFQTAFNANKDNLLQLVTTVEKKLTLTSKKGNKLHFEFEKLETVSAQVLALKRRTAEKKNHKKQKLHESLVNQSTSAMALFDRDLKYLAVSEQWLKDYKVTSSILGQYHYDVYDIPEKWKEVHRKSLNGEIHSSEEDFYLDKDGKKQFLKWLVKPWFNDSGEIGGLIMQTTNLSPLKHLEQQSFKDKQLMKTIFNSINVGVVVCNEKGELTFFNQAAREWHGIDPESLDAKAVPEHYGLYYEDGSALLKDEDVPLFKVLRGEILAEDEIIAIKSDVHTRLVQVKGAQLFDKNGKLTGAAVTMYDITKLRTTNEKLRISEQTFRGSFYHAAIGMAVVSTEGKWIRVNDRVLDIFGYKEHELLQLTFQDITHPDDLDKDLVHFERLLNNKAEHYQIEKRYFHKSGEIIHAILSVSIVRDEKRNPLYFVSQITDITEVKKSKSSLEQILKITKSQNERLRNFAYIVSHNLRSHTSNIDMLLKLLIEQKDYTLIDMLEMASNQLGETIEHLNEVAAINAQSSLNTEALNLKNYLSKVTKMVSALIQENEIQIIDEIEPEICVDAVPAYLESILLNFTTNGIKYSSKNRESFLRFYTEYDEEHYILNIQDNGLGIDLKMYGDKLFGMYKTFHNHKESVGIGLFITKNQIEAIGGKVKVYSEVDKGTTFKIYFKRAKENILVS